MKLSILTMTIDYDDAGRPPAIRFTVGCRGFTVGFRGLFVIACMGTCLVCSQIWLRGFLGDKDITNRNRTIDAKTNEHMKRLVVIARWKEDVSRTTTLLGGRIPYEVCRKGDAPRNKLRPGVILPSFYVAPN